MPRFVPASVAELQRVGLFGSLSGEQLARLADASERLELPSGATFGGSETTVDILLTGLARTDAGLLRPGDLAPAAAMALTACVVARAHRDLLSEIGAGPAAS